MSILEMAFLYHSTKKAGYTTLMLKDEMKDITSQCREINEALETSYSTASTHTHLEQKYGKVKLSFHAWHELVMPTLMNMMSCSILNHVINLPKAVAITCSTRVGISY